MDLKSIEEDKSIKPHENNELKRKMHSTPIEGTQCRDTNLETPKTHIKGNKCTFGKNSFISRSKTTDWVHLNNGHHSNIPQPLTLIRSKSCDKNAKSENILRKIDEKEEKKYIKPKCTYEKYKAMALNENLESEKMKKPEPKVSDVPQTPEKEVQNEKSKEDMTMQFKEFSGFSQLLPLCEKELKKIEDAWLSSIYCSMTSRVNLVKLLFQECPNIQKGQFQAETEKLLKCFEEVKTCSKNEAENLMKLVKSLLANREKAKEEIALLSGSNSERNEIKKGMETEDENKQLKTEPKKKENQDPKKGGGCFFFFFPFGHNEANNQLNSKQKEITPKNQSLTNVAEEKNPKETINITMVQKEFDDLKRKYSVQNEANRRKVKDLETLFEEKCNILRQQKEMKTQLQSCLNQFQEQKRRLSNSLGYERLEFLLGRSFYSRSKRREEVWLTSIRLIVKGFLLQIKNLESQRNKLLFQLQSNDIDNLSPLAITIIQQENFLHTIKRQMKSYHKAYRKLNTENKVK